MKGWPVAKKLNAAALQAGVWNGIQYAVPVNLDVRGLIYNAAMFKKAGISTPPRTWAEYKADAAKLVQKHGGKIMVEGADWAIDNSVGLAQTFDLLLEEAGGSLFHNGPNGTATFTGDSAAGRKALNYLVSFYKDGLSSTSFIDVGSAPTPVALGNAAMEISNASSFAEASPTVESELKMTAPLAATAGGQPVGIEFVNKLGIYSRSKNPEAAWKFINYLYTPSILSTWNRLDGEAPPEVSLADTALPVELQSTIIDEDLTRIVSDAIYGAISVPDALAKMRSEISPLLNG
jgi:multiple sugar transport system substrate-binding protein